jgi:hypothetical protein
LRALLRRRDAPLLQCRLFDCSTPSIHTQTLQPPKVTFCDNGDSTTVRVAAPWGHNLGGQRSVPDLTPVFDSLGEPGGCGFFF